MEYIKTVLKDDIVIKKIVSIHYFEYARDYVFEGERHDFWEFVYVDKGELEVMADDSGFKLKQGEMIFHKPNEFHNVWANGKVGPNLVIVTFECKSSAIRYFENKILCIDDTQKNLLARIIWEAKEAFSSPLNLTYQQKIKKKQHPPFGSEQLIRIYLEQMLICLIRKGKSAEGTGKLSSSVKERSDNNLITRITEYLKGNIRTNLTFEDVCRFSKLSRTSLKVLFREHAGMGVMEYFRNLKIEASKKMIREEQYNFTEIANQLGYSSIHYFSRHFKKATDMTPSQYATSVKVKMETDATQCR